MEGNTNLAFVEDSTKDGHREGKTPKSETQTKPDKYFESHSKHTKQHWKIITLLVFILFASIIALICLVVLYLTKCESKTILLIRRIPARYSITK